MTQTLNKRIVIAAALAVGFISQPLLASGKKGEIPTDESPKQTRLKCPEVKKSEGQGMSVRYGFGIRYMNGRYETYAKPEVHMDVVVAQKEKPVSSPNLDEVD